MNLNLLKSSLLAVVMCCVGGAMYGEDVVKYSLDDASSPTLTLDGKNSDRGTANYDYKLNDDTFLNVWGENNSNGSKIIGLTTDNIATEGVEWTLEFDWAGYSGCNKKAGYTQIGDIDGNTILSFDDAADWGKTFSISIGGTLSCYPCNKLTRISATTGSVLTAQYWHHIKLVGNTTGIKLYVKDYTESGTLGETYSIDGATVSSNNASPAAVALRPGSCGSVAINNVVLSKESKVIETVSYTVKFVCGTTEIKTSETRNVAAGSQIVLNSADKETFYATDGKKYFYEKDDASSVELKKDGSTVVTVTYREAANYSYTVTSSLGTTIASGKSVEGDAVTVGYPHYINNNGTLYSKGVTNKEYRISFTPDADNYSKTLDYTATQTGNVVYWSEAEDIEGLTTNTYGNVTVRASNALAALASTDTKITTLPAGKYIIHAGVFSSANNPDYTIKFTAGSNTLTAPVTAVNASEVALDEITLNEATDLTLLAEGMDKNCLLDYIYICRTGEIAPVTDAKFATYSPSSNIKVGSNSQVKFYTAKIASNKIELTEVADATVLKAGTGYVIAAETGNFELELTSDAGTEIEGNELLVAGADGVTADDNSKYYVLTKRSSDNKVGFGKVKSGVMIPAGKCYIDASSTPATASLTADFLEMTNVLTGINAVDAETEAMPGEADAYYTLQGIRVSQPVKGINIINGKKVIVK